MQTALKAALLLLFGCAPSVAQHAKAPMTTPDKTRSLSSIVETLVRAHSEAHREPIERGLAQIASLWRPQDGDLAAFAQKHYISDPKLKAATFARLEALLEQMDGHLYEISRALRWATDVDEGPLLPIDPVLAAFDPSAHLSEDLYAQKLAFIVLLNFPRSTLEQKTAKGASWSRQRWAEAKLADRFGARVPAEVAQRAARAAADADLYISQYNIWMHHVLNPKGERLFERGLKLISHWNLRDQLKADYASPRGLEKQRLIVQVMERIVTQTIPKAVINNPRLDWEPFSGEVRAAKPDSIEESVAEATPNSAPDSAPEPNVRYAKLLAHFHAAQAQDPHVPSAPTRLQRAFEIDRELSEARVESLLKALLESELVPKVAALIQARLGRALEPQDLWYDGFKARSKLPQAELTALTQARYPNAKAFEKDLPIILKKLGFAEDRARFLASHIKVDPSRGAGHAMPAYRRQDLPRLRTRIGKNGMDYKGYNIAIHELGHNVEQVFSLYEVDHTLLTGVPNNAFTEALAFVFQARDLQVLGKAPKDPNAKHLAALATFWNAWEIAGVALVDTAVWRWMYAHPDATPQALAEATARIAKTYWNRYYAPHLGKKDSVLLAVYSHMIAYPLYLSNYPLGHLIAYQIEEKLSRAPHLGAEFERMASFGAVIPDLWMQNATGAPVSADALLNATSRALEAVAPQPKK